MNAHQDVHVRPDHPDFQHVRPFLTGDLAKEPAKEARQPGVDQTGIDSLRREPNLGRGMARVNSRLGLGP